MCQETVLWTSVSDCMWCHPQALKMRTGGKWAPLWVFKNYYYYFCVTPAVLRHFGTFIKCHHNRFLPFWTPLYICKKNFSTRAHAPVREHRPHVNAEQMWGDMRRCCWSVSVIFFELWACWCLQLATPRAGTPECSCFTWSALPTFFSPQLECLMSCVVTGTVLFLHVMSWATLSTGKFIRWATDPVWS